MAGSADHLVQSRRRRRGIEEGEGMSGYYSGSDTDTDDEDAWYYLRPVHRPDNRHGMMATVARPGPVPVPLLEDVVGGSGSAGSRSRKSRSRRSRSRSTTRASSSLRSDGTISDADAGGDAAAVIALFLACPVCHRQFHSSKAVHGHMRVHVQAQPKEEQKVSPEVSAVDEVADSVSVSMAIHVVEVTKISDDLMPVEVVTSDQIVHGSGSGSSASVESSRQHAADLSMAILVAEAAPPAAAPKKVDIAPTSPAPEHKEVPVPAPVAPAPELAAVYLHPPAPAQQHVAVAPPQAFHGPLHIIHHQDPAAPRGFSCKECYRWFETHQGLGGHVAGHKNRRIAAAAAAAIAAGLDPIDHAAGGPRPERPHTCKVCGAVYTSGFRLGGHMRKHYTGKPIVPRKQARLLFPPDVMDVMGLAFPGPAPAMEAAVVAPAAEVAEQPPQAPAVPTGCLRIFGVTIVQQEKKEEEEEPQPPVDDKQ